MFLIAILFWAAWSHHPIVVLACLAQIVFEICLLLGANDDD